MNKKRKKLYIISAIAALVSAALIFAAVFAFNVLVEYNYNFESHADLLTCSSSYGGSELTVTVTRTNAQLWATKADIIVMTADEHTKLKLGSVEADY